MSTSNVHGFGLFAKVKLAKGDLLCRYTGTLVRNCDVNDNVWVADVEGGWGIDSSSPDNESGRWCNHSVTPNAKMYIPNSGTYDSIRKYYYMCIDMI